MSPKKIKSPQRSKRNSISSPQKESQNTHLIQKTETFSGPLPPPDVLARYDQIKPGFAERIVAMAERQSAHRQELETKVLRYAAIEGRIGQIFALVIAVFALGTAAYLGVNGATAVGSVIGGTTVVGLVAAFVVGRRKKPG